ncbi:MAG: hypothetical protein CMJ83_21235 [Planctomycetes bacterium]|nr:hypothetical protein [Planctomycetota bacterium]
MVPLLGDPLLGIPSLRYHPCAVTGSRNEQRRPWRRRVLFAIYAVVAGFLLLEVLVRVRTREQEGYLRFGDDYLLPLPIVSEKREMTLRVPLGDLPYLVPDPGMGWTIRSHGKSSNGLYFANGAGLRSPRELPATKAAFRRRVLVVGDSLAHGDDLKWEETWIAHADALLGPDTEVWCGAVPGYGTDQALLRLERLLPLIEPDVVVLTVYRQNLLRNLTFFRCLQHPRTALPWSKPRFVLDEGGVLRLENRPAIPPAQVAATLGSYADHGLCADDRFWRPDLYADDWRYGSRIWRVLISRSRMSAFFAYSRAQLEAGGAGVRLGVALVARFIDDMKQANVEPYVVILPDTEDVQSWRDGRALMNPFLAALDERSIAYVETGGPLADTLTDGEAGAKLFVGNGGHPNHRAAQVIGKIVAEAIR